MFQPGPDPVNITSTPPGAQVLLDGASVGSTPVQLLVHRKASGAVTVQAPGYYPVTLRLQTSVNGSTFLNLLSPWLVGFVIDGVQGNCSRWESPGQVALSPIPGSPPANQPPAAAAANESASPDISSRGTGFFITQDGFFVTNEHVVSGGRRFQIRTETSTMDATLVHSDPGSDIAVLRCHGTFSFLAIRSTDVRLGSTVATVGFPNPDLQGFAPKLSKGEISSLAGIRDDPREYQISVPIQPGNSGGALIDERGNAVGIVSARISQRAAIATSGTTAQNVNYAVKGRVLAEFLEKVPGLTRPLPVCREDALPFEDAVGAAQQATAMVVVFK